ncbi:MAG: tetratricopeptide repeat protein [Isosphaerales bacterium]
MNGRRVLVIGSQCKNFNHLSFLPDVAQRLHAQLIAPGPGECIGAEVGDPPGLLLDPTVQQTTAALTAAVDTAATSGDFLILWYIGHGDFVKDDFFLLPTDAVYPPNLLGAVPLIAFLKHLNVEALPGLILVLDTCHSGTATYNAAESWVRPLEGRLRFEVLTATDYQPTANAWFTRSLIQLLERGDPAAPDQLRCEDARKWVVQAQPRLAPQRSAHNSDEHFYLGRNSSKVPGDVFWKDSPDRAQILEQTEYYQPTAGLAEVVAASQAHRSVILTGESGVGKSSLAAALARPEITQRLVPPGFVHAVALLGGTTNLRNLAVDVEHQLRHSVAGFAGAVEEFHRSVTRAEREKLDFLSQMVLRTLDYLDSRPVVRVVLDGLDQLPDGTRRQLHSVLGASPDHLRLIMTARDDTPDCPDGEVIHARRTDRTVLGHYLEERGIPEDTRAAILDRAQDHWLIAQLLADAVLDQPGLDLARLPGTVNEAYELRLDQAGAAEGWQTRFRPVLGPLAVAGNGPILPLALLVRAIAALGGPSDDRGVLDVLGGLRGLVARRDPGTADAHFGLFHPTLAEYLLSADATSAGFAIDAEGAHRALAVAIDALAPASDHEVNDSLHRYAFLREADHWWALGEFDRAVERLSKRESNSPRENLDRWRQWHARILDQLGCDHPNTLAVRSNIARWTGDAGDAREALRLFQALLPDLERVLGRDHTHTLITRNNIAGWTGETGDAGQALRLFQALLPDRERVLGHDHPDTLTTRNNVAQWTGKAGDAREALRLSKALLLDRERVLSPEDPETLITRNNIAGWTGETGDAGQALRLFQALLPDQERVLGRDHPHTLNTRNNIAGWTGKTGNAAEAVRLFQALLTDQERVLGRDHPDHLDTRSNFASWTGLTGNAAEALRMLQALLPDQERVLGRDHPNALNTLGHRGVWTIRNGGHDAGCQRLREGLSRAAARFGPDHPTVRMFRDEIRQRACGES